MILVTGDTHGTIDFNKIKLLEQKKILRKEDFLIIAGDFGGVWSLKTLEEDLSCYARLPFKVLFVDGNHENFDILNSFSVQYWNGGKIHKIKDNIFHLMRGQVYEIEGKIIFTFGGGTSIDKYYRVENISWWKEEIPNENEVNEAITNLKKYNNKVDYIITHSIDSAALDCPVIYFRGNKCQKFKDNEILDYFERNVEYKHWYFGHYHVDGEINNKKTAVYNCFHKL